MNLKTQPAEACPALPRLLAAAWMGYRQYRLVLPLILAMPPANDLIAAP